MGQRGAAGECGMMEQQTHVATAASTPYHTIPHHTKPFRWGMRHDDGGDTTHVATTASTPYHTLPDHTIRYCQGMRHDGGDTTHVTTTASTPYHTIPYHQGMRHDGGDMTHVATAASTIHQPRGRGWAEAAWGLPNTSGIYLHSTMQILHFVFDPDSYWA